MSDPTRTLPDPLITVDPGRMSGAPCFTGTRVPVQNLFDYVEGGEPLDEFLLDFPNVTRGHAIAVIELTRAAAIELALPNDDLPEPERPVNTTSASRGISRSTFLRLCSRAPRT